MHSRSTLDSMAGECVFCRGDLFKAPSNEHIFPQWLLNHLGIPKSDQLFQGVSDAVATADEAEFKRIHGTWNFVEGRVCELCNNGWMARLETAARPALIALIDNIVPPFLLPPAAKPILVKWAVKTAYLVANVSPLGWPVPPGHLWALNGDDGAVMPGVSVFCALAANRSGGSYIQSSYWHRLLRARDPYMVGMMKDAYKIGLQFGHLMLLVAYAPHSRTQLVTAAGIHVPLNAPHLVFPSYGIDVSDAAKHALWTMTRTLGVLVEPLTA